VKVLTWLWEQPGSRTHYTPWHVRVWSDMVRRHLTLPHTLAVVTDVPGDYGDVEVIKPPGEFTDVRIPTWNEYRPQCHRRLSMFRRDAADLFGTERIVCMDLDVVIGDRLDPLFEKGEDFRMARGTAATRLYNGSMMMIRCGARPQVYESFTPEKAVVAGRSYVGSDQSWISYVLGPGEATWKPDDGFINWNLRHSFPNPRMMTFPGGIKPWRIAELGADKWVMAHYRRSRAGRCLVLGYGQDVWKDVEQAIETGEFNAVIASPEAAKVWPGKIIAVADDDDHAGRLASMHGFSEVVYCGRNQVPGWKDVALQ